MGSEVLGNNAKMQRAWEASVLFHDKARRCLETCPVPFTQIHDSIGVSGEHIAAFSKHRSSFFEGTVDSDTDRGSGGFGSTGHN